MRKYCFILLLFLLSGYANAQFLFSESFVTIPLDTSRKTAGMISGRFNQQTQKYIVTQIGSRFEFARRLNKVHVLTLAGNFQVVRNGNENVLTGGYVFGRFRNRITRKIFPEYMAQYQWFESRGLEQKFAITANMRYRFVRTEKLTLAAAMGFVGEYEKWNYSGVPDEKLPTNTNPKEVFNPRFNSYVSYDQIISDQINVNASVYYMHRLDFELSRKRLGFFTRMNFKFTNHISYAVTIKLMHDYQPIVPVSPTWYIFTNEVVFNF